MAKSVSPVDQNDLDIFVAYEIFPDPKGLFSVKIDALESIKSTCMVVVDTNVLLLPYSTSPESLERIGDTYRLLAKNGQLIVPGQVAREFARNRATKLAELFQQIVRRANVPNLQKGKYPLLESVKEYQELVRIEREIDSMLSEYRAAIEKLKEHVRAWTWNDPVSLLYAELFNESVVLDPDFDQVQILEDLNFRQKHKIPPGFKDAGKDDRGIGDLLIWHTVLLLGRDRRKSVVFVTGDEKADWFHRSENQALYPRFELIDEFRRKTDGFSFYIISLSELLDLYGASSEIVHEVRQQETQESQYSKISASGAAYLIERLIYDWLRRRFPNAEIDGPALRAGRDVGLDFDVLDDENGLIGVEVKYFRQPVQGAVARLRRSAEWLIQSGARRNYDQVMLVLVASDLESAVLLNQAAISPMISERLSELNLVVGYISQGGEFVELPSATSETR